jgi:ABC-type sugar transport system substrate-binding protein
LFAVVAVAAGCGSSSSSSTSSSSGASTGGAASTSAAPKPIKIAFLPQSVTSYTGPLGDGVREVASQNNGSVKVFSANDDPSRQLSQCETAINGGYNAILIQAVDHAAAMPCVQKAVAKHIIVIPTDQPIGPDPTSTKIQMPGVKAQVIGSALGVDVDLTVGLVKQACSKVPAPCKIMQVEAIPQLFYSSYKVKAEQPKFKALGYQVVATKALNNFDAPDAMKSAVLTELAKNPDIDVIVSDDDSSAQGAVQLKKAGKLPNTVIIGDGGNGPALKAIKAGDQFGTTMSLPKTTGEHAALAAVALLNGKPVAKPSETQLDLTKFPSVTQENVSNVTNEW